MTVRTAIAAALAAAMLASAPGRAEEPADTLETVREMNEPARKLRTAPSREDIRAAAMLIRMQACFELNEAVIDYPAQVGPDAAQDAAACLRDMQRLANQPSRTADAIAPWIAPTTALRASARG